MTIMYKEVKTPAGVVTITASVGREGPEPYLSVIEYNACVEVNGLVHQYSERVPTSILTSPKVCVYQNVEHDLLRGLAMQLFKEGK